MAAFDWKQYPPETPSPQGGGGKFDWNQYPAEGEAQSSGALSQFAKSTIDALPALGGMAGGVLGTPADVVSGPAGSMAGAAIGGYLGSAAKNLINKYYDPSAAPQSAAQTLIQPLSEGAKQGAMQGVADFAAPYVSKGIEATGNAISSGAKKVGAKLLSFVGGANPTAIKEYAEFSDRINAAPTLEKLKEVSDDFVGKLAADVDAKKLTADQAKEAYQAFHADIKDTYRTAAYDARDAVTSAHQSLKDAHNSKIQGVAQDVYDTIKQLKNDVTQGSQESYKILDKSGESIPVAPIKAQISSLMEDLKVAGKSAVGEDATSAVSQLQKLKSTLDEFPEELPATQAKKMLQQLQRSTDYSRGAGTFSDAANKAYQAVNSSINTALKSQVPEYAEKMGQVAGDTDLLSRVSEFGDKQTAAGLLPRLDAANQLERKAAMDQLGKKYGTDFLGAVNPKNLPEHEVLNQALARQEALRPDRMAEKVGQSLGSSRQQSALDAAQSGLKEAQERLAPFKSLAPNNAGQTMAQQKLKQLGEGQNIELEGMFKKLGGLTNTDFIQAMKDQSTLASFQKGAANGSRNTLMGAITGFLFGGVPGAAGGGAAGRVVDQWGPAITKKVLDGAIAISKKPTVQAIRQLSLPEPVQKAMIMGLQSYWAQNPGSQGSPPAPTGESKWANQGIQKLGIQDQGLVSQLLGDPKGKQLLIQASDLAPGSQAMKNVMDQIQKGWGSR